MPSAAEQQTVLKQVDEIYDLAKKRDNAATLELARELLQLSGESRGKPATQFALLRKTAELASRAGDALLMVQAVDTMARDFQIDPLVIKGKMLRQFATTAKDAPTIATLVAASRRYIEEAMAAKRYDFAIAIAEAVCRATQHSAGRQFRKDMLALHDRVQKLRTGQKEMETRKNELAANPDDPDANLFFGRYYCFTQGDWSRGLPHLAKGGDTQLATVAAQDANASPDTLEAGEQVALADAWWNLAGQRSDPAESKALKRRAAHWYRIAREKTSSSLTRLKIDKRLKEAGVIPSPRRRTTKPQTIEALLGEPVGAPRAPHVAGTDAENLLDGAVLLLTFDKEDRLRRDGGFRVKDRSGSENHAKPLGATWTAEGKVGGGCVFDGTDDYVACDHAESLSIAGPITISMWVNLQRWDTGGGLCTKGVGNGGESWLLDMSGNGVRFVRRRASDTRYTAVVTKQPIRKGQWHHVVAVADGKQIHIYLDGKPQSRPYAETSLVNKSVVAIGSRQSGDGKFDQNLAGVIDEVGIWNRALSDEEINKLRAMGTGGESLR